MRVAYPDGEDRLLRSRVARHLREAILDGRLTPGSRIRQEVVAGELQTSRIPVREALRELEGEGLFVLRAHTGAWVSRLDLKECAEVYKLRERVEPLAIAESISRLPDDEAATLPLRQLLGLVERAQVPAEWLQADRDLHLACYAGLSSSRLLRMIEGFWNTTQHYRRAYNLTLAEENFRIVNAEHLLLLDAVERRDTEHAEQLLRLHIRRTRLRLGGRPELFDSNAAAAPAESTSAAGPEATR